jgi:hypothetical protein
MGIKAAHSTGKRHCERPNREKGEQRLIVIDSGVHSNETSMRSGLGDRISSLTDHRTCQALMAGGPRWTGAMRSISGLLEPPMIKKFTLI